MAKIDYSSPGNYNNNPLHKDYEARKAERSGTVGVRPESATFTGAAALNSKLKTTDSDISRIIKSHGIHDVHEYGDNWFTKFARFGIIDPYNGVKNTREYIFITKPDLHLVQVNGTTGAVQRKLQNNPFFIDAIQRYPEVVKQLQYSYSAKEGPFACMLSNAVSSAMELPAINADSVDTPANAWGTKMSYRGSSLRSDEEIEFSLEFTDTRFLEVYMFFKMFDEYEKLKWEGILLPDPEVADDQRWINYTVNKVLHDQMTAYKFVVGDDGMSLMYWARATGIYPTGAPRDAFSDMNNTEGQKLTTNWKAFRVRDMDPMIIKDFNRTVQTYMTINKNKLYPLYDNDAQHINGEFADAPCIMSSTEMQSKYSQYSAASVNSRMQPYYLMWMKK